MDAGVAQEGLVDSVGGSAADGDIGMAGHGKKSVDFWRELCCLSPVISGAQTNKVSPVPVRAT